MKEIYIAAAVRTAIGKYGGTIRTVPARTLAALIIRESLCRAQIEPVQVEEVVMGQVRQSAEASNLARVASLGAGIPEEVPAFTVNRLCSSAMQAMNCGFQAISMGDADVVVAGGAEEHEPRAVFYCQWPLWRCTAHVDRL